MSGETLGPAAYMTSSYFSMDKTTPPPSSLYVTDVWTPLVITFLAFPIFFPQLPMQSFGPVLLLHTRLPAAVPVHARPAAASLVLAMRCQSEASKSSAARARATP